MSNIIGISWCKNEGDLLPYTLEAAIKQVDAMMIIDDNSTDNSWDIIQSFKGKLEYCTRKCLTNSAEDSRNHMLNQVRARFGREDTWVQVIESDTIILQSDIRSCIDKFAVDDVAVHWNLLNACRRDWSKDWNVHPLVTPKLPPWEAYPDCHFMEMMTYTFRPLEKLEYTARRTPWPQGFSHYTQRGYRKNKTDDSPLALHYGYRTPKFFYEKMKAMGRKKGGSKYSKWRFGSAEEVRDTVDFFNGTWNNNDNVHVANREGWSQWIEYRREKLNGQDS